MLPGFGIPIIRQQHGPGRDGVHDDIGGERASESLGQHDHACFADAMRHVRRPGLETREVREIDDFPFRPAQMGDGTLRHEEHRAQIQVQRRVPTVRSHVLDGLAHHDRRRVDEDVETLERARRLVGQAARRLRIGEIGLEQLGAATCFLNRLHRRLGPPARAVVVDGNVTSRARQADRDRLAEATPGSRHQGDSTVEPH